MVCLCLWFGCYHVDMRGEVWKNFVELVEFSSRQVNSEFQVLMC